MNIAIETSIPASTANSELSNDTLAIIQQLYLLKNQSSSTTRPTNLPMKARLRGKSSLPVKHSIHPSPHRARTPILTQFPAGTSVSTSDDGEFDEVTIGPSADDSGVM